MFACVYIDSDESASYCGARLTRPQQFFARVAASIPGFSGDVVGSSACAPYRPSPCDSLRVPNLVTTNKIVLVGSEDNPMRGARSSFRVYTKAQGKLIANLVTDSTGVADVSAVLQTGKLMPMFIDSGRVSGEFLVRFGKDAISGQETIKLFCWRCRGNVMQSAVVQP